LGFNSSYLLVNAYPHYTLEEECHDSGDYEISSNLPPTISVRPEESFNISINASGPDLVLKFNLVVLDNRYFETDQREVIIDNGEADQNPEIGYMQVMYLLKAPPTEGNYDLYFYCMNETSGHQPDFAHLNFSIQVGKANTLQKVWNSIYDHYNAYLGLLAMIFFTAGIYATKKDVFYAKQHGILMTLALFLTVLNLASIWGEAILMLCSSPVGLTAWLHYIHILVGFFGLGAFLVSFVKGIAGYQDKKIGYLAYFCWLFNLILGFLLWGVNF